MYCSTKKLNKQRMFDTIVLSGGIDMIKRDEYLEKLNRFRDKQLIKVVTGIRRCGKSTLLEMYKEILLNDGIDADQIISINLEDLKYNFITDYLSLYN